MEEKTVKLVETVPFMAVMTALGGFCNAYTFLTRGGVFANGQTANMARLGICLVSMNWSGAVNAAVAILGCFVGALLCEAVKDKSTSLVGGHWHRNALIVELLALLAVGFIPTTVPHVAVNAMMSAVTGFQLNMFRNWAGGVHNTTICTGNTRSLAQFTYAAVVKRVPGSGPKLGKYALLFFSFTVGAALCALLCLALDYHASWLGCVLPAVLLVWMHREGCDRPVEA